LADTETMGVLLDGGAAIDAADEAGMTPLMRALQHNKAGTRLSQWLLDRGAQATAFTAGDRDSTLMIAVQEGREGVLAALAERGADPNHVNSFGEPALFAAVKAGRPTLLQAFLSAFPGVNLNQASRSGTVPMALATHPKIAKMLLNAGANPDVRSTNPFEEGRTVLMMLAAIDTPEDQLVPQALAMGANPNLEDNLGRTAMAYAIMRQNPATILALYRGGFEPSQGVDRAGQHPMALATRLGDPAMGIAWIEELSALGVPVDLPCRPGHTPERVPSPLAIFIQQNAVEAAAHLLKKGADPVAPGPNGRLPIQGLLVSERAFAKASRDLQALAESIAQMPEGEKRTAAEASRLATQAQLAEARQPMLDLLAQQRLDWNTPDAQGQTLLGEAAAHGYTDLALWAMDQGARPGWAPEATPERDAFRLAAEAGQVATLHALMAHTAIRTPDQPWCPNLAEWVLTSPDDPRTRDAFLHSVASLTLCPEWATWVNTPDEAGNTPLLLATATGQTDLLRLFVVHGAAPNQPNAQGETPVMHAVLQDSPYIIQVLVGAGANPHLANVDGHSALSLAQASPHQRDLVPSLQAPLAVEFAVHPQVAAQVQVGRAAASPAPMTPAPVPPTPARRRPTGP
jgi:ankyrin repeat protein